jgi:hypothetical protein
MRATWRLRSSATITVSATSVTTAPAANAQWKPTTSACAGDPPAAVVLLVAERREHREAKRAADLLRGVEEPRREPLVLVVEPGRRDQRERHEHRTHPEGREQDRGQHVHEIGAVDGQLRQQKEPDVLRRKPATAIGRTPRRGANCDAIDAESITPAVNGRNARPAFKGP